MLLGIPGGLDASCTAAGGRLDAECGGNLFTRLEVQDIRDGAALGRAAHFGNLVHPLDIAAAGLGEEDKVVMRTGREEMLDEIAFLGIGLSLPGGHTDDPLAAALLRAVGTDGCAFDKSLMGDSDDTAFIGYKVLDGDLSLLGDKLGEAGAGVLITDRLQLGLDDRKDAFLAGQDVDQVGDRGEKLLILGVEFVSLEASELVEAEFEDGIGLRLAEAVLSFVIQSGFLTEKDAEFLDLLLRELDC